MAALIKRNAKVRSLITHGAGERPLADATDARSLDDEAGPRDQIEAARATADLESTAIGRRGLAFLATEMFYFRSGLESGAERNASESLMSPTVAELAAQPRASFTFSCRPCARYKFYYGDELRRFLARLPPGETLAGLKARMICPQCRRGLDGNLRTFEFQRGADAPGHGWSGPKA